MKKSKDKNITSRVWEVVTDLVHPLTSEKIIDLETVQQIIDDHKSIKEYAYIVHDKDKYISGDKIPEGRKIGELKPAHVHIVLHFYRAQDVDSISKWFGIPSNFIEKKKGVGAFYYCVEYLTHSNEKEIKKGKFVYSDDEVHCKFEDGKSFREFIEANKPDININSEPKTLKDQIGLEVLEQGRTLESIRLEFPLLYSQNFEKFRKLRNEYLDTLKVPEYRLNIYIEGSGGVGKGLISKALARALIDEDNTMEDKDIYCCVGAASVTFEAYEAQKVLIWDDCRSFEIMKRINGRGSTFNVFDTKPQESKHNKKYGSVSLVNEYNIVNSVQPWSEFLDGLAGAFKDKDTGDMIEAEDNQRSQAYRRFPIIIRVHPYQYDIFINKGFFEKSTDYLTVEKKYSIDAPMRKMISYCGTDHDTYRKLSVQAVQPIVEIVKEAKDILVHEPMFSPDELMKTFDFVGKI